MCCRERDTLTVTTVVSNVLHHATNHTRDIHVDGAHKVNVGQTVSSNKSKDRQNKLECFKKLSGGSFSCLMSNVLTAQLSRRLQRSERLKVLQNCIGRSMRTIGHMGISLIMWCRWMRKSPNSSEEPEGYSVDANVCLLSIRRFL